MTFLVPPAAGLEIPADFAPVRRPAATSRSAGEVSVGENGDPLVPVPSTLEQRVFYDTLPLPKRGALWLRGEVVDRLLAAQESLPDGFRLVVLDGWRSPAYQQSLLRYYRELYPELSEGYVADPRDAALPPHTTGGAVDLTLGWGEDALALGTEYDAFEDDAHPAAFEGPEPTDRAVRDLRRMFSAAMTGAGFAPYPLEWWHWSYGDQWWAAERARTESLYGQREHAEG